MIEDYDLIESSFLQQYGIRLRATELEYDEFLTLLAGLSPDTPLGAVVAIRSEDDSETLKLFNPAQVRIRNEWRRKQAKHVSKEEHAVFLEQMKDVFRGLAKK